MNSRFNIFDELLSTLYSKLDKKFDNVGVHTVLTVKNDQHTDNNIRDGRKYTIFTVERIIFVQTGKIITKPCRKVRLDF